MSTTKNFGLIANDSSRPSRDFGKIKIGRTTLSEDAYLDLDYFKTRQKKFKRSQVDRAMENQDINKIREISNYFFYTNGIYGRLCRYMAYLYKYDWFITPIRYDDKIQDNKVIEGWYKASRLLDNSNFKQVFGEIALKVILDGCYYGYAIIQKNAVYIQELPYNYCRSRFFWNGKPVVEFNVKYFDDKFPDIKKREKILKVFAPEFRKAYLSYKKNTGIVDSDGWFALDVAAAFKFNMNALDYPFFAPVILDLMDLDDAQDLDKKRMAQQLLRLVIQEMPLDKNFEPVFDIPEIQAFHNNAVQMVGDGTGISVLTTLAKVAVEDLSDGNSTAAASDQLEKVERSVYNSAGVSQMQFNSDGNIALEKSIANDEAAMTVLINQFESFLNGLLAPYNKNINRLQYRVDMLPTTIYNYKDLSKLYKEQMTLGFSKLLSQVALGHPQSVVLATAFFENDMLHLEDVFVPPQMSSTMGAAKDTEASGGEKGGRPETPDDEKAEQTIKNIESES